MRVCVRLRVSVRVCVRVCACVSLPCACARAPSRVPKGTRGVLTRAPTGTPPPTQGPYKVTGPGRSDSLIAVIDPADLKPYEFPIARCRLYL